MNLVPKPRRVPRPRSGFRQGAQTPPGRLKISSRAASRLVAIVATLAPYRGLRSGLWSPGSAENPRRLRRRDPVTTGVREATLALRTALVAIGTVLALAGCGGRSGAPATPHPKDLPEFQQAAQAILAREHVPGAGIALVARDHVIWAGGLGKADLGANQDATDQTMFRVGSISKSFVALALLKLQEEGRVNLSAPVRAIAPGLPIVNRWEGSSPITVAEVLEHSAGFDDMLVSEIYNLSGPPDLPLLDVLRRFPEPLEARWPPGTRMSYSNPGYGVAGFLIEQVTQEKFDDYIEQNILVPLGMAQSNFVLTDQIAAHLARGYEGNPPHPIPPLNVYLRSAGNLYSSPAELAHLVQMFLDRGKVGDQQLVSEQSILRMEYPQTTLAARAGLRDGYGFANYADLSGSFVQHGHDGGIDGYISTYRYLPDQGVGYVVLLNSSSSGRALEDLDRLACDYVTAGMTPPQPPTAQLGPVALETFTGYYEKRNPRHQGLANFSLLIDGRRVSLVNGTLYERGLFGRAQQLVPVGPNQFRTAKQPEASTIFTTDAQGQAVLAELGFYGVRTSIVWPLARLVLIALGLVLMASAVAFALFWFPRLLLRRMKGTKQLAVRAVPLAAVLWLVAVVLLAILSPVWLLGAYDILSVGVWLAGWLFLLFSVWAVLLALRPGARDAGRAVWIHSLLVSIACCGIAGYLLYWHWIGLRLWAP
jgi:CubicO group peptidase (beta-lactamase class C family)